MSRKQCCNTENCYKCLLYEDCDQRYQKYAAPLLLGVIVIGVVGVITGIVVTLL